MFNPFIKSPKHPKPKITGKYSNFCGRLNVSLLDNRALSTCRWQHWCLGISLQHFHRLEKFTLHGLYSSWICAAIYVALMSDGTQSPSSICWHTLDDFYGVQSKIRTWIFRIRLTDPTDHFSTTKNWAKVATVPCVLPFFHVLGSALNVNLWLIIFNSKMCS